MEVPQEEPSPITAKLRVPAMSSLEPPGCEEGALPVAASKRARTPEDTGSDGAAAKNARSMHLDHQGRLKLVGDSAPPCASWVYPLADGKRRSFAGHLPGALPKSLSDKYFDIIKSGAPWIRGSRSSTAWLVKPPCCCRYQYSTWTKPLTMPAVHASDWPGWLDEILGHVMPLCGIGAGGWPNSCNVNHYADGWEGVGWHADDEPLFQGAHQDCTIVSLSFGQARLFSLCPNDAWDTEDYSAETSGEVSIQLGNGDLCTMEGLTQKYYQHGALTSAEEGLKGRINLTFRWIVQHTAECGLRGRGVERQHETGIGGT